MDLHPSEKEFRESVLSNRRGQGSAAVMKLAVVTPAARHSHQSPTITIANRRRILPTAALQLWNFRARAAMKTSAKDSGCYNL
jgi:hypothetical protein